MPIAGDLLFVWSWQPARLAVAMGPRDSSTSTSNVIARTWVRSQLARPCVRPPRSLLGGLPSHASDKRTQRGYTDQTSGPRQRPVSVTAAVPHGCPTGFGIRRRSPTRSGPTTLSERSRDLTRDPRRTAPAADVGQGPGLRGSGGGVMVGPTRGRSSSSGSWRSSTELGWTHVYGPDIAPGEPGAERATTARWSLNGRLRPRPSDASTPTYPPTRWRMSFAACKRTESPLIESENWNAYRYLIQGVPVEYRDADGQLRTTAHGWSIGRTRRTTTSPRSTSSASRAEAGHVARTYCSSSTDCRWRSSS